MATDGGAMLEKLQPFFMINTVLSSISSPCPVWSRQSSFLTANSSKALQMSFADKGSVRAYCFKFAAVLGICSRDEVDMNVGPFDVLKFAKRRMRSPFLRR